MNFATDNPKKIKDNQFKITTSEGGIPKWLISNFKLDIKEISTNTRKANITDEIAAKLRKDSEVDSVIKVIKPKGVKGNYMFPEIYNLSWNNDNYGPIYIPKKGSTIDINTNSLPFYKRLIKEYENNQLDIIGDHIFINGKRLQHILLKRIIIG